MSVECGAESGRVGSGLIERVRVCATGRQSLGEEYCDIIQVKSSTNEPATLIERALLIASHVLVPYVLATNIRRLSAEWRSHITRGIAFAERLHLAIFYCSGTFYNISKRFFSIHYVGAIAVPDADRDCSADWIDDWIGFDRSITARSIIKGHSITSWAS